MSNAVNFVPFLWYLPSTSTTRAQCLYQRDVAIIGGILSNMDEQLQTGESLPDCLAKSLLENRGKENHNWLNITMLCAVFIVPGFASVGTKTWKWHARVLKFQWQVTSVVRAFAMIISCYPEAQEWAHEELDRVVGRDQLPTVIDEQELPFIHAIIKVGQWQALWICSTLTTTNSRKWRGSITRSGWRHYISAHETLNIVVIWFPRTLSLLLIQYAIPYH